MDVSRLVNGFGFTLKQAAIWNRFFETKLPQPRCSETQEKLATCKCHKCNTKNW